MPKLNALWQSYFLVVLGAMLMLPSAGSSETGGTSRAQHKEWEPSAALRNSLEDLQLRPKTGRREDLAGLRPHLEEALTTLTLIERQRGLSARERSREEAFRMLLTSIEEIE